MGTSKSYEGVKGNPNWSNLSRSITRACDIGDIPTVNFNRIVNNFNALLGGSNYGGRGNSTIGGRAGIKTGQKLGGVLQNVKNKGFSQALSDIGFVVSTDSIASDVINHLLEYCAGVAISIDEAAAKEAERQLLEEICSDAQSFQELEANFTNTIEEFGIEELLIKFYAYYIYEHLSIDFYEKLIIAKGERSCNNLFTQLKDFLIEKVRNVSLNRDLSKIAWDSEEGETLVKNIFEDTLKAFEHYEG